jgi:hypothetical protein
MGGSALGGVRPDELALKFREPGGYFLPGTEALPQLLKLANLSEFTHTPCILVPWGSAAGSRNTLSQIFMICTSLAGKNEMHYYLAHRFRRLRLQVHSRC